MNFRTDFADERLEIYKSYFDDKNKESNNKIRNKKENKESKNKESNKKEKNDRVRDKKQDDNKENNIVEHEKHNNNFYNGIKVSNEKVSDNIEVNIVDVTNNDGEKILNKKIGTYTTIDIKDLEIITKEEFDEAKNVFAKQIGSFIKDAKSLLVIGLGNSETTADSIGPKVVNNLKITRHILKYEPNLMPEDTISVSALAPGVLGTTGIETEEIVKSVVKIVNPDKVIVIDAMATSNVDRLLKNIQISDTGIEPGAGVNNKRKEISNETIGVPVIAIGVPTVVDSDVIVAQSFEKLAEKFTQFSFLKNSSFEEKYKLVKLCNDNDLIVMPKDIDSLVDNLKEIISYGINNYKIIV